MIRKMEGPSQTSRRSTYCSYIDRVNVWSGRGTAGERCLRVGVPVGERKKRQDYC